MLSALGGFSKAMPAVSLWILGSRRRPGRGAGAGSGRARRALLGGLLLLSAATYVGAFAVALAATWAPSLFAAQAAGPLHLMNSLLDVPAAGGVAGLLPGALVRQARLRHINEMTGTSSGFFLAAGLLWRALEARGRRLPPELVAWMFLVSLVAGPAAGAAAVLLLLDLVASRGDGASRATSKPR